MQKFHPKLPYTLGSPRYRLLAAGRGLILGDHIGRHPASVLNVIPLLARPVPDLGGVERAAAAATAPTCAATAPAGGGTHLASVSDISAERRAELLSVLRVKVDLVFRAV